MSRQPARKPHPNLRPWKPGQSGNPKGRPPGQSVTSRLKAALESGTDLDGRPIEDGTLADMLARTIIRHALAGDLGFIRVLLERVEGRVADRVEPAEDESQETAAEAVRRFKAMEDALEAVYGARARTEAKQ